MFLRKNVGINHDIIDFHVHIIHNVDDGPASIDESIEMAKALSSLSIKTAVATPHYISGTDCFGAKYIQNVKRRYDELVNRINEENIALKVIQGFEVNASEDMMYYDDFDQLTVANTKYMLVELPFNGDVKWLEDFLYTLKIKKINPILVHPERCSCFGENLKRVCKLADSGIIMQLNVGSFCGFYGRKIKHIVTEIFRQDAIFIFGSDTHSQQQVYQLNNFTKYFKNSARKIGRLSNYFYSNSDAIINGLLEDKR